MIHFMLSILLAVWFQYEFKRFPKKINLQIYQDFCSLYPLDLIENDFLKKSNMQYKEGVSLFFFILFPLLSILFNSQSIILFLIVLCLCYLSILDYSYYLADIKYIVVIFFLSMLYIVLYDHSFIQDKIITLLSVVIFFIFFFYFTKWLFEREVLGLGDILLIVGLSPLFFLEDILWLLFISSISGVIFSIIYFLLYHKTLVKLAFIPFISFGYLILSMFE